MQTSQLNALRSLEAVLRLGSFRAAGEFLGVTSAAVGQQVRGLEEAIGRPLFARNAKGLQPTSEARRIAPRLTAAMTGLTEIIEGLERAPGANVVAVSLTTGLATAWLPSELPSLYRRRTEIDLRLDTSPLDPELARGNHDFALVYGSDADPTLEWRALFPGLVAPVCTPEFARRHKLEPGRDSLDGVPLHAAPGDANGAGGPDWQDWCMRLQVAAPTGAVVGGFTNGADGLHVAQSGMGLALSGLVEAFPALRDKRLVMPFGPESVIRAPKLHRLVWLRGRRLTPAQSDFVAWAVARAEAHRAAMAAHLGERGRELVRVPSA